MMEKKGSVGAITILLLAIPLVCFAQDAATIISPEYKTEILSKQEITIKRTYHDNGKVWWETPYNEKGQIEGTVKHFNENGQLTYESPRKADIGHHGVEKSYYHNGILQSEKPYKNNFLDGICRYYDKEGKLTLEESYERGKLIKSKNIVTRKEYLGRVSFSILFLIAATLLCINFAKSLRNISEINKRRPLGVTVLGIISFLIVLAYFILLRYFYKESELFRGYSSFDLLEAFLRYGGWYMIIYSIITINLLLLKSWARLAYIVFHCISVVCIIGFAITSIVIFMLLSLRPLSDVALRVAGLAILPLIFIFLTTVYLTRPKVKEQFK